MRGQEQMTDLEKIRNWISAYPGADRLGALRVDECEAASGNGSIAPAGLVEVSRREDVLGNVTVENRHDFALHYTLAKAPGDGAGAAENADWIMGLQQWVQEQSLRHLAPTFGDEPQTERIQAQNGKLLTAHREGTAVYTVRLTAYFTKIYEVI